MSKEYFTEFTNQLSTFIQSETITAPPMIGVIIYASENYQYCDVKTDQGTLSKIPAHGLPVIGDTAIIHFINGNYEMPVADCARRLPAPTSDIQNYQTTDCYNYLDNGDFHNSNPTNMTGNYTITSADSYTLSDKSCLLSNTGDYIECNINISNMENDYFKFQAMYKGMGSLSIECIDTDTNKPIKNLPYSCSYEYKIWQSPSRIGWRYNKEVYPRIEDDDAIHKNIQIRITNTTEKEDILIEDTTRNFNSMLLSALLVYDENSDKNYYNSINDVISDDTENTYT